MAKLRRELTHRREIGGGGIRKLATQEFLDASGRIRDGYEGRVNSSRKKESGADLEKIEERLSPFSLEEGYIKREFYILIKKHLSRGSHKIIKNLSKYYMKLNRQPLYENNPFYWGIIAIDPKFEMIDKKVIKLYSLQLLYANMHQVPPEHLVGFLYQLGSPSMLRRKLLDGKREDEFLMVRNRTKLAR